MLSYSDSIAKVDKKLEKANGIRRMESGYGYDFRIRRYLSLVFDGSYYARIRITGFRGPSMGIIVIKRSVILSKKELNFSK